MPSIGVKKEDLDACELIASAGFDKIIIDVNHGHHKAVADTIKRISDSFPKMFIMAGNVSSTDGIKFLIDSGADVVKIGNSFGFSCTTIKATGFGVHPLHVAKSYREETGNWDTQLCIDGGLRNVADIAKSMIWADLVMVGKMFAGCDESKGSLIGRDNARYKTYWGNASVEAKRIQNNHIKYIEGTITEVPYSGPISSTLDSIKEGLQSAFSFVGAHNLNEYQVKAQSQVLLI